GSDINNYIGVPDLTSATVVGNVVTLTYATAFETGTNYILTINNIEADNGSVMSCPFIFEFSYSTSITIESNFITVTEDTGTLEFVLTLANPSVSSVDLVVKG